MLVSRWHRPCSDVLYGTVTPRFCGRVHRNPRLDMGDQAKVSARGVRGIYSALGGPHPADHGMNKATFNAVHGERRCLRKADIEILSKIGLVSSHEFGH